MGWFRVSHTLNDDVDWGTLTPATQLFVIKLVALRAKGKPLDDYDDDAIAWHLRLRPDALRLAKEELLTENMIQPGSWHLVHEFRWFGGNERPNSESVNAIRQKLYRRDGRKCCYCGVHQRRGLHVDHKVPISRGGTNDMSNLVLACSSCNLSKGARTPEEWGGVVS
jgi:5-methylcytosine-specific restriction endonuclease McrA